VLSAVEVALGHEAAGRRAAVEGLALAREVGGRASELANRGALGFLALSLGDVAGAAAEMRLATEPLLDEGYLDPAALRPLPDWAGALVTLDRVAEASTLLDRFEGVARRLDRQSALAASLRVRGLIATTGGDEEPRNGPSRKRSTTTIAPTSPSSEAERSWRRVSHCAAFDGADGPVTPLAPRSRSSPNWEHRGGKSARPPSWLGPGIARPVRP
jgi:hypothetical protein